MDLGKESAEKSEAGSVGREVPVKDSSNEGVDKPEKMYNEWLFSSH